MLGYIVLSKRLWCGKVPQKNCAKYSSKEIRVMLLHASDTTKVGLLRGRVEIVSRQPCRIQSFLCQDLYIEIGGRPPGRPGQSSSEMRSSKFVIVTSLLKVPQILSKLLVFCDNLHSMTGCALPNRVPSLGDVDILWRSQGKRTSFPGTQKILFESVTFCELSLRFVQ